MTKDHYINYILHCFPGTAPVLCANPVSGKPTFFFVVGILQGDEKKLLMVVMGKASSVLSSTNLVVSTANRRTKQELNVNQIKTLLNFLRNFV